MYQMKEGVIYMRVQVNLSDEMVSIVDEYAKSMGVSRSAFCSMLISQGVMSYDKNISVLFKDVKKNVSDK
jgi:metal-responsive CopG/Arc/MetJ family transcriptional regulator